MTTPATAAREPVFISKVVVPSLVYHDIGVMKDVDFATALTAQIQVIVSMNGMARKPYTETIALAKQWGVTLAKSRQTVVVILEGRDQDYALPIIFKMIQNEYL